MNRLILTSSALVFFTLAAACAPSSESDSEAASSPDAVTVKETVESSAKQLLTDFDASQEAYGELAIAKWQVFTTYDKERNAGGAIAYGVGYDDQIRYALLVTPNADNAAQLSLMRFDANGPSNDQQMNERTRTLLLSEMGNIGKALESQKGMHRLECGAGIGFGLLLAVSAVGAAALAPVLSGVVWASVTVGEWIFGLAATAGLLVGGVSWVFGWDRAVEGAKFVTMIAGKIVVGTVEACGETIAGR